MKMLLLILILGLALCGYLVRRQKPAAPAVDTRQTDQAVNQWQGAITLDLEADYSQADPADRRMVETLRSDAARQKPEEGRN
ncbi:MAG: hypothetical protein H7A44_08525 [Opitutaceae bacterium]|nr:hypothetical protein [Cephaloticoccus sp.]MCP5530475.1 hypothetical protein [Opitutaceae bacterium]